MGCRAFRAEDAAPAAALLADRHKRERLAFPALKRAFEDSARAETLLREYLDENDIAGVCAVENGALRGYLIADIEDSALLGNRAFAPYIGMAIAADAPPELYRLMYAEAAKMWVKRGALHHYALVPAGDGAVMDKWLRLGFAYQQAHGLKRLKAREAAMPQGVTIRQAEKSDAAALRDISGLISLYQAQSPVYAYSPPERLQRIRAGFGALAESENDVTLLALRGDLLIGFQCADLETDEDDMLLPECGVEISVSGTVESERGRGIGGALTSAMFRRLTALGYENAAVDWRVTNLASSNFWEKQGFAPYAYRLYRRIDERDAQA